LLLFTNMVTLVVADDHPAYVAGLARVLERCRVRLVACCTDGRAALDAIVEHRPDVALLDLRMPLLSGREVLGEVRRLKLPTRVLICSAHTEPPTVHALIEDGARGYIGKTAPISELCAAVRKVAAGGMWLSPELQAGFNDHVASGRRMPSERELEAIRLVAKGLTDREIGLRMHVSHETVRTNLKRSQEKLGVSGRAALAATAVRRGLIE
jgi:two-component system, NarL family, nitrate/nitrite response regulator NarL